MAELRDKFEKLLESDSAPVNLEVSNPPPTRFSNKTPMNVNVLPTTQNKKLFGIDKTVLLICLVVIVIIFFKYNDIVKIFSPSHPTPTLDYDEVETEDENDAEELHEEPNESQNSPASISSKKVVHESTKQVEFVGEQSVNSNLRKKNKDPLFQEFK